MERTIINSAKYPSSIAFFSKSMLDKYVDDDVFSIALAIRTNTDIIPGNKTCNCGKELTLDHAIKCPRAIYWLRSNRHNAVKCAVRRTLEHYGLDCSSTNVFVRQIDDKKTFADLAVNTIHGKIYLDFTIVNADVPGAAQQPLKAIRDAEQTKKEKYTNCHNVFAFAADHLGAMGPSTDVAIAALEKYVSQHRQWSFKRDVQLATATAIHKAQGDSIREFLARLW